MRIETGNMTVSLAPRYRLGNFQLGALATAWVGPDVGLSERTDDRSVQKLVVFAGPQVVYDLPLESRKIVRIGLEFQKGFAIENKDAYSASLNIQFGFDLSGKSRSQDSEPEVRNTLSDLKATDTQSDAVGTTQSATEEPAKGEDGTEAEATQPIEFQEVAPPTVPAASLMATGNRGLASLEQSEIHLGIDIEKLYFDTRKNTLRPEGKKYLQELAGLLIAEASRWEHVYVDGHADSRGEELYNLSLSYARARQVEKALVKNGIPIYKVYHEGFGESRPSEVGSDAASYAKNRRVEIRVLGRNTLSMRNQLMNKIKLLGQKHFPKSPGATSLRFRVLASR